MDMYTTAQIKEWLEKGVNVFLAPGGDPLFLLPDGSVRNRQDQIVMVGDSFRAHLYTKYFGRMAPAGQLFSLGAPAVANASNVHAAVTGAADAEVEVTTGFTNPDVPRSLSITPGGTTADVKACTIMVYGTDYAGNEISEGFAFLENASTATAGVKAFKTVTRMVIPAQDGAAATFAVGRGNKLGLPFAMDATSQIMLGILGTTITAHNPAVSAPVSVAGSTIEMSAGTYNGTKEALVFLKV